MAFGKCGCVPNREVRNNTAKGNAGQDRGCHKTRGSALENAGGGGPGEGGGGGRRRVTVAPLALHQGISFSEWQSPRCPSEAASGLGRAAAGGRKWTVTQ